MRLPFLADLTHWTVADYERQWRAGLRRIVEGAPSSALLTAYRGPGDAPHVLWALWRDGEHVYVQERGVSPATLAAPFDPWDDRVVHAQELQEARAILDEAGISAEYLEPAGDPARTIEGLAADNGFDVIVVGSRGLGAVSRFLQGSVSEHVATHAKATVVIAR